MTIYSTYQAALADSVFAGLTDAAAILVAGNAAVQQTSSDLWPWHRVVNDSRFGKTVADAIYSAILANSGAPAAALYLGDGIDLSLPDSQAGLTAIAAAVPALASVCDQLKLLGVWQATYWQQWGLDQPQLADITTAMTAQAIKQAVTLFCTEVWNPAISAGQTPTQLKALVAAWSAS